LLAGRKAPGNLGAMVDGIKKGFYLNIAGGKVKKSILMADDIAYLLPLLEEKGGIYNVCDTYQPTFGEIAASVAKQLGKHKPISIPYWMAWCMAKVGDFLGNKAPINSYKLEKITKSLTFSNEKARRKLGWEPLDVLKNYKV
jgi:nucleoside-diphosphate-sugar epimerase